MIATFCQELMSYCQRQQKSINPNCITVFEFHLCIHIRTFMLMLLHLIHVKYYLLVF